MGARPSADATVKPFAARPVLLSYTNAAPTVIKTPRKNLQDEHLPSAWGGAPAVANEAKSAMVSLRSRLLGPSLHHTPYSASGRARHLKIAQRLELVLRLPSRLQTLGEDAARLAACPPTPKLPQPLHDRPAGPLVRQLPRCATRHRLGTRRYTDRVVCQIVAFVERVASVERNQSTVAEAAT
jgi:hypothetical protein